VPFWPSLAALPEPVGGVLTVVPPAETEKVVAAAHAAGITRVWMQQGSESDAAIRFCEEHGIAVVQHECVLMFAEARPVVPPRAPLAVGSTGQAAAVSSPRPSSLPGSEFASSLVPAWLLGVSPLAPGL
jgi:hypothetical protein